MKLSICIFTLFLGSIAWSQTKYYPNAYVGTDVIQAGPAPFNSSTSAGTVLRNESPYNIRLSQITDNNTQCGGGSPAGYTVPGGGGSATHVSNTNVSLIAVTTVSGNQTCVLGYNPSTLIPFPIGSVLQAVCTGQSNFASANSALWLCFSDANQRIPGLGTSNGTTLYGITFARSTTAPCGLILCYDPGTFVWSKIYDFANCPQAQTAAPLWHSNLGLDVGDSHISISLSWAGFQGTGNLYFVYDPVRQTCKTLDTVGNGTNPIIYANGTSYTLVDYVTGLPATYTGKIHEANMGNNVGVISLTATGSPLIFWNLTSLQSANMNGYTHIGGHAAWSANYYFNDGNPAQWSRPISNPANPTQIAKFGCQEDKHFDADTYNDTAPMAGTSGSIATTTWTNPDCNEVYALDLTGTGAFGPGYLYRFSPTWSSGPQSCNFYGHYSIAAVAQDRKTVFFTSDMLLGLGNGCQTHVFAADLTGN